MMNAARTSRLFRSMIAAAGLAMTPAGAAAAAVLAISSAASAQVKDVTPYFAVVTAEGAPLRSAEIPGAYRVAELPKGQVVKVDGESAELARVLYPAKTTAFLKIEDAGQPPQVDTATNTVRLLQPTKLRAANAVGGIGPSWMLLQKDPFPADKTFKLVETMKGDDGTVQGYRVIAPEGSRGYIAASALRRATDAEVAAFQRGEMAGETKPAARTPETKPVETPRNDARPATPAAPANESPAAPAPVNPETAKPAGDNLLHPMTPEGTVPAPATTPRSTENSTPNAVPNPPRTPDSTSAAPTPTTVEQKPVHAAPPADRAVGSLEALDASFQKVRREPILEAELDPLITELERALDNTDKSKYPRRYAVLVQRRDYLRLQVDYRDRARALEEAKRKIDEARDQSTQRLAELEAQRVYTVVGQLLPSNVYDGKDLPLMYRLQSVGGVIPRTLGYLKPQEQLQLPAKLGMVVGVVGQATLDPSLRLNIFDAVHVDVLKAADNVAPASNSAPPDNPPADLPEPADIDETSGDQ